MKTLKIYLVIFLFTCSSAIFAQLGDCTGALLLENKDDVTFTFSQAENQFSDLLSPICTGADALFNDEDGSLLTHWFTWTIKESGTLYFTLSIDSEFYDLDFILYKSNPNASCPNKEAVRCMFSGETAGFPSDPCLLATGLSPNDTDLFENAGCSNGDNNFLQQIDAIAGEQYKLLVINFGLEEDQNTLLELCGTATLGDTDSPCFTLDTNELNEENRFSVYPNPSNSQLFIANNNSPIQINFPFTIIDQVGEVVIRKDDNSQLKYIETNFLQSGIYFININTGSSNRILKFVKL